MKILVTGGAGFIGTNLIKRLLSEGHNVISIDNYSTGKKENEIQGCKYYNINIGCRHNHPNYLHHINDDIQIIYHLAAKSRIQPSFVKPEEYIETNYGGTFDIVKYCSERKIPLIYAGSSSYHSGKLKNPYTFSKTIGEEVIQLYEAHFGLKCSIARFYNVYGPYQLEEGGYTTLIGRWMYNIKKGLPCKIYGDGEQRRDFTHIDDIVDALVKIMNCQSYGKIFELGRRKNYSINEVAAMFKIKPIYTSSKPGEARNTLCESKLAKEILGWNPKRNLLSYIKQFKNENIFYNTEQK